MALQQQVVKLQQHRDEVLVLCGDIHEVTEATKKADIIVTSAPPKIKGKKLASIIDSYKQDHLILLCSMQQFLEFVKYSSFEPVFDFPFDISTASKKISTSKNQLNYIHINAVYMTRNNAESILSRKCSKQNGAQPQVHYPTIPTVQRIQTEAIKEILKFFDVKTVLDIFTGSGVTALACAELEIKSILVTKISEYSNTIEKLLKYLNLSKIKYNVQKNDMRCEKEFSYLNYLDRYSDKNLVFLTKKSKFTQKEISDILNIPESTVNGWYSSGTRKRTPPDLTWRFLLYELHARQHGYQSLKFLVEEML